MANIELRVAILRAGLRHVEVARKIGRSPSWLSQVINGWNRPSPLDRRKISRVLGVPEQELFPEN